MDLVSSAGAIPASVVTTPPGRPEALFRVGAARPDGEGIREEMRTGPWLRGWDAAPCARSLGVFLDDLTGNALLAGRPADYWPVSTELSIDLSAPPPLDGSLLTGWSRAVSLDPGGGLGQGTVTNSLGRTVATATARARYLPAPRSLPSPLAPVGEGELPTAGSTMDLLGATARREAGMLVLTLPGSASFANPMGNTHGGVLLCAAEIAGSLALHAGDRPLRTSSIRMIYVRPVPAGGTVTFTAEVLHRGRTLGAAQVIARDAGGKTCAVTTITGHDQALPR